MQSINTIETEITKEGVTGFRRMARHESFAILPDLNMVQQVRIITLAENGSPMIDRINADDVMTPSQKKAALVRYEDQVVNKQTMNAFVDKTGKVVAEDAEGAIPQKLFFQAITLGDLKAMGVVINDKVSIASLLYTLIGNEIKNIDRRADL